MAILQLSLPVLVILAFICFKLNHEQKRYFFKVPIWISSTVLSLGLGHLASGVMGFYAAIFCDLLLYPLMLLVYKAWKRKDAKLKQKQEPRSKVLVLPMRSMAVS